MGLLKRAVRPSSEWSAIALGTMRLAGAAATGGAAPDGYSTIEAAGDGSNGAGRRVGERAYRADPNLPPKLPTGNGESLLHECAKYGRAEELSRLLALSLAADVSAKDQDGRTALHAAACWSGSALCVDQLIRAGVDVAAVDSDGCTALHLALKHRQVDAAKLLLTHSIGCLSLTDSHLRTPLHDAVLTGSEQLCQLLIRNGAAADAKDAFGRTPLMLACSAGLESVVRCLLQEHLVGGSATGAPHPAAVEDNEGAVAIHYAVLRNHTPLVELVSKHTADVNKAKRCGSTALHLAVSRGYRDAMEILIACGAQVNAADADGATPLHCASNHNQHDCAARLLQKGADANICDYEGRTASHLAAAAGHVAVMATLLRQAGAQQQLVGDSGLRTPLHHASSSGHLDCVSTLLDWASSQSQDALHSLLYAPDSGGRIAAHCAAARPDGSATLSLLLQHSGVDASSWTDSEMKMPLHSAAEHDCPDCIEVLLAHGADIAAIDLDGCTALHLACARGCDNAAAALLTRGASSNARESNGRQPLLLASKGAHASAVRLLLDNGCEVNAADGFECSALHLACSADSTDVVRLLVDAGCNLGARDSTGVTPLQQGITSCCSEAATEIVMHEKWELAMNAVDHDGFTPMCSLIERLPTVAQIVLDKCVRVRNDRGIADVDNSVVFDYKYIDPHPDDLCCSQKKQWFVQTIVDQKQEQLLFHPLVQSSINYKWSRFGMYFHWFRFATFLLYLAFLTAYTLKAPSIVGAQSLDLYGCTISNTTNSTLKAEYQENGQDSSSYMVQSKDNIIILLQTLLMAISVFYLAVEIMAMAILRQGYLLKASSYINLLMIGSTLGFTLPPGYYPCLMQWRCGWISNLCVWACLVLFLGSFDFIGIYVIMFTVVTKSLLKLLMLLMVFFLGFSIVFNLLQSDQTAFASLGISLLEVFDMANGEINFSSNFLASTNVFAKDSLWAVAIFMFLINIVLINLTIGVSIGDIENMRASARFQMMAQKVEWIHHYENTFPLRWRRYFYAKEHVKEVSTFSPAKAFVVSLLRNLNDALKMPVPDPKPQECSNDDLKLELQELRTQIAALAAALNGREQKDGSRSFLEVESHRGDGFLRQRRALAAST